MVWNRYFFDQIQKQKYGDGFLNSTLRLQSFLHEGGGSQGNNADGHLPLHYTIRDTAGYRFSSLHGIPSDYNLVALPAIVERPLNPIGFPFPPPDKTLYYFSVVSIIKNLQLECVLCRTNTMLYLRA